MGSGGEATASGSGSRSHAKRDLLVVDRDLAVEHQGPAGLAAAAARSVNGGRGP
jgi:hypothetical protein